MAERSFKQEVAKLKLGAGEEFRGEGILAVTKALLQSGVSYVSGYQGAPISHLVDVLADANDILQELGIRFEASANEAAAAADAGRLGQLSAARRRHLQVDGRHQRRLRRARQSGVERRDRRRADHRRRGLRRRLLDHAGAQPRLRDEVADLAARSAPQPALDRAGRGEGLRAVGSLQHAGDAGAAHPRLPCLRQLHRRATMRGRTSPSRTRWRSRCATPTASCCRRRATCTSGRRSRSAGRPLCASSSRAQLNEFFDGDADDIGIVMQGGMYNTALARARSARPRRRVRREPRPALRAQRHLSADRCRVRALLRRQEGDPDDRGGPAGISSSRRSTRSCGAPTSRPGSKARACCRWPANIPAV